MNYTSDNHFKQKIKFDNKNLTNSRNTVLTWDILMFLYLFFVGFDIIYYFYLIIMI